MNALAMPTATSVPSKPNSTAPDLARLFAAHSARRWALARSTAAERVARLRRLRAAVVAHRAALAAALQADFGKSPPEVEITEIHPVLEEIDHAIRHLPRWMRPLRRRTPGLLLGARSEIRHEARGVVLVLAPWNYPFGLLVAPLVAAIAAGNAVTLKPSEKVPHTARVLREMIESAFPADEVAVVEGGADVADALLELPYDHVFFTGSTRIGKKVMAAAARHLATVTLELGGKSPVIVDETADLALAAERVMWGKTINAGQTCVAPDHAFVPAGRERAFVEAAIGAVKRFYGETEDDRARSPDLCRVVDDAAFARLRRLVDEAVAAGARVELGGRFDAATRYVAPTILTGVTLDMGIMQEEIFGPILPILGYDARADVIRQIQARDKPLALYVFSRDDAAVGEILADTSAGGTVVNHVVLHLANPHLPFGGVGASGQGNYHGVHGFRAFSHARAVLRQGRGGLARWFYPPYGRKLHQAAARLLRAFE